MIRRGTAFGAIAIAALALSSAATAQATAPPAGPRLLTMVLSGLFLSSSGKGPAPSITLETLSPTGEQVRVLVRGRLGHGPFSPNFLTGASWSSDGATLAFTGGEGKRERIFVVSGAGGRPRPVKGTRGGGHPVISPDGQTIAFARTRTRYGVDKELASIMPKGFKPPKTIVYSSTSTWMVDARGGRPRRLTPERNHLYEQPTAFSPDGGTLALTRQGKGQFGPEVVLMDLASAAQAAVAVKAEQAAFSPDGSRIAYVGYADADLVEAEESERYLAPELYVMDLGGGPARRLTHSRGVIESAPSWDPSGSRIAYVRARASTAWLAVLENLFPVSNSLMQMNADGSCPQRLASHRGVAFYGAAWQPGPGREAGPISC